MLSDTSKYASSQTGDGKLMNDSVTPGVLEFTKTEQGYKYLHYFISVEFTWYLDKEKIRTLSL